MLREKPDYLFEICFEVCNKVGGIYTVVASKAKLMQEHFGGSFFIIGPYFKDKANEEFIEHDEGNIPEEFKKAFENLSKENIRCHFGKWNIEGEPNTILIDASDFTDQLDHLKKQYWEKFRIDSIGSGYDFFEPMLWSSAAGKLVEEIKKQREDKKIIAHAHEWISGFSILFLKIAEADVFSIFTTHATMLGRTISGNGRDLYGDIKSIQAEDVARELGVIDKHSTEKALAHTADVFTTVSHITALEATHLLDKKPEPLLLNGLDLRQFPKTKDIMQVKSESKKRLCTQLKERFNDINEDSDIFFTSGRYEFSNKGMDIFVDALGEINEELKSGTLKIDTEKIFAIFFVPAGHNDTLTQKEPAQLSTHELIDPDNDPLIKAFRKNKLSNDTDDRVRVLFLPTYLDKYDNFLDRDYYDVTLGCDVGVFASYYEPCGYTPAEANALGCISITSDLAGYGRFMKEYAPGNESVHVIERFEKTREESTAGLKNTMIHYITLSKEQKDSAKIGARKIIEECSWQKFFENYEDAYDKALKK